MSRRNIIKKFRVLNAVDSTTNPASTITDISGVDNITYQITVGAAVNATFSVKVGEQADLSDAKSLGFGVTTSLIGATDTEYMVAIENKGFKFMRLDVANNGGTGNISGWISGNTVGA